MQALALTNAQLESLVERALAGEGSLDQLFHQAVFGGAEQVPRQWGDWPQHAREDWDAAAHLYFFHRPATRDLDPTAQREQNRPRVTLRQAWEAVEKSAAEPGLSRLTWTSIAAYLPDGVGTRGALYQLNEVMGFLFGGRQGTRSILAAPCLHCGVVYDYAEIERRTCPACRALEQAPEEALLYSEADREVGKEEAAEGGEEAPGVPQEPRSQAEATLAPAEEEAAPTVAEVLEALLHTVDSLVAVGRFGSASAAPVPRSLALRLYHLAHGVKNHLVSVAPPRETPLAPDARSHELRLVLQQVQGEQLRL